MEEDSEIDAQYGIKYINMITKFSNVNKEIGIHISNSFPIKFVYNLEDWKDSSEEENDTIHYIAFYFCTFRRGINYLIINNILIR